MKRSRRSFLDRYLTAWSLGAMAFGIGLGWLTPGVVPFLNRFKGSTTSIPIPAGVILMLYPPFTRVRFEELHEVFCNNRLQGQGEMAQDARPIFPHRHNRPRPPISHSLPGLSFYWD